MNCYRSKVSKSKPSTSHPIHGVCQPRTQIAAELSHHAIWVRRGDLGQACQNENVAVFERSLVHGLKNQRELCLVIQKEMVSISSKGEENTVIVLRSNHRRVLLSSYSLSLGLSVNSGCPVG